MNIVNDEIGGHQRKEQVRLCIINIRMDCISFVVNKICQIVGLTPPGKMSLDMTNQQNECAFSEDSDQPGHPPSLIRVFAVHSFG